MLGKYIEHKEYEDQKTDRLVLFQVVTFGRLNCRFDGSIFNPPPLPEAMTGSLSYLVITCYNLKYFF